MAQYITNTKKYTSPTSTIKNATSTPTWGIQANPNPPLPSFNTANSTPQTQTPAPLQQVQQTQQPTSTSGVRGVLPPPTMTSSQPQGGSSLPTGMMPPPQPTTPVSPVNERQLKGATQTPFGGLVNRLSDASTASQQQQNLNRRMEEEANRNREIAERAGQISDMYGQEIAQLGRLGAGAQAGALTTGSNIVGAGNAAVASQSVSQRMQALADAQQAALQGTGQQLTGQQQLADALNQAMTARNTQQQLQLSGLGTAAGLTIPTVAQYGQTVFDPITGQYTGAGGNMDPQMQAQTLAQQVMSGQISYDQALDSLGYAGNAGATFLNNAITGSGGNPLQLQAQTSGSQANIGTQTTAQTEIARAGLQQATQDYVAMTSAGQFADEQAKAVTTILSRAGLNDINSVDANKALNTIRRRFSDPDIIALDTALREAQIAYTNLLSTGGGTPSGREANAVATLNFNQSAAAIQSSINELENAVARRLQAQYSAMQQYQQNLSAPSGGGTGSGGLFDW